MPAAAAPAARSTSAPRPTPRPGCSALSSCWPHRRTQHLARVSSSGLRSRCWKREGLWQPSLCPGLHARPSKHVGRRSGLRGHLMCLFGFVLACRNDAKRAARARRARACAGGPTAGGVGGRRGAAGGRQPADAHGGQRRRGAGAAAFQVRLRLALGQVQGQTADRVAHPVSRQALPAAMALACSQPVFCRCRRHRFSEGCTAVAVATARGFLGLHLLAGFGGGAAPAWCESAPQCVSEGLEIQAVRSQVRTTQQPAAAAPWLRCRQTTACAVILVVHVPPRGLQLLADLSTRCASGCTQVGVVPTGSGQPALLLLDVVNLSLPPPDGASAAAADEDDDGEVLAIGGGTSAASVALLPDAVAPEVLYAVHCSAAHAITLSWLPLLAGLLEEVGGARLPAALPQPAAELLMRSGAGVAAAAAVGDTLSGSALVVLEADGKPRCLRPHRADATAAAGGAGGGGAASAAAASAPAGGSAAQRDVEAQLATIYGDLRKGATSTLSRLRRQAHQLLLPVPRAPCYGGAGAPCRRQRCGPPCPLPASLPPPCLPAGPKPCELPQAAAGRAAGAGNLEGQRLLNEAAAALRASHVEFAHQAHQDLTEVCRQPARRLQQLPALLAGRWLPAELAWMACWACGDPGCSAPPACLPPHPTPLPRSLAGLLPASATALPRPAAHAAAAGRDRRAAAAAGGRGGGGGGSGAGGGGSGRQGRARSAVPGLLSCCALWFSWTFQPAAGLQSALTAPCGCGGHVPAAMRLWLLTALPCATRAVLPACLPGRRGTWGSGCVSWPSCTGRCPGRRLARSGGLLTSSCPPLRRLPRRWRRMRGRCARACRCCSASCAPWGRWRRGRRRWAAARQRRCCRRTSCAACERRWRSRSSRLAPISSG